MAGQEAKITEKSVTNTFSSADKFVLIKDDEVRLVNVETILSNVTIGTSKSTPANSTITVKEGKIWYDTSYLYIAVANNTVKRIALDSF